MPLDIQRVPEDIRNTIFQHVIDDEAASLYSTNMREIRMPKATTTLALVCRQWQRLVYGTPALWAVFVVNITERPWVLEARCARVARQAKQAPLDVLVSCVHPSDLYDNYQVDAEIPREITAFKNLFTSDVMIQRLRVHVSNYKVYKSWQDAGIFASKRIQDISYTFLRRSTDFAPSLPLDSEHQAHFMVSMSLKRLHLGDLGLIHYLNRGELPPMPSLEVLTVGSQQGYNCSPVVLNSILKQCPNLVKLDYSALRLTNERTTSTEFIQLPKLTELITVVSDTHLAPFKHMELSVPSMTSFTALEWRNDGIEAVRDLFTLSERLQTIALYIDDASDTKSALRVAHMLRNLTLFCRSTSCGSQLLILATTGGPTIWPYLESIKLDMPSISPRTFSQLVRAYFLPWKEGRTQSGRVPVKLLRLRISEEIFSNNLMQVKMTTEWKSAKVTSCAGGRYELYWPNR
ncbi:hypothetical protein PIIN_08308 [Serendipita indica DSM 11827]|uniref:F-box domain-containing protein n=1 Tax=Serendipita indica (strain DSM 11827) TaxID=1109443 RepID=G4TSR2_SERID|nr:hypothetical protein PIIN_08308 [Serendipita indica DSM 11827]